MSYNAYDKDNDEIIDLSSDIMVDAVPTEGSTRPVSSGGVYDAVDELNSKISEYLVQIFSTNIVIKNDISVSGIVFENYIEDNRLSKAIEPVFIMDYATAKMYKAYIRKDTGDVHAGEAIPAGNYYRVIGLITLLY